MLLISFEEHFANDCAISQKSVQNEIVQINFQDNSLISQNNNQEITNFQNNSRNYNPVFRYKKYGFNSLNSLFSNVFKKFSYSDYLAYNFENIIYTRAP